jgi:hypothetical protein
MWELVYHTRRYLAWSAFGIVVFVGPLIPLVRIHEKIGLLLIVTGFGGGVFVLLRALVGAVTGWSARRADRATAIGIRRFFVGWSAAFLIAFVLHLLGWKLREPRASTLTRWIPQEWAWLIAGGLALVLTGWLIRRSRGWLILPGAWLGAFVAIMGWYFALTR